MIRRAREDDVSGIALVHVEAWQSAYANIVPRAYLESLSIEKKIELWRRLIIDPCSQIWVSLGNDCVNGFISGGGCRDDDLPRSNEIYALYVSPNSQRQGVGRALVKAFLSGGGDDCVLWVFEENRNAINFYRSVGFEVEGRTKVVERDGETLSEARYRMILDNAQPLRGE